METKGQPTKIATFFISGFSFWSIHDSQDRQGNGEAISLTPLYHFHVLHRDFGLSGRMTAESSPLHITNSRTRTGNILLPSASR